MSSAVRRRAASLDSKILPSSRWDDISSLSEWNPSYSCARRRRRSLSSCVCSGRMQLSLSQTLRLRGGMCSKQMSGGSLPAKRAYCRLAHNLQSSRLSRISPRASAFRPRSSEVCRSASACWRGVLDAEVSRVGALSRAPVPLSPSGVPGRSSSETGDCSAVAPAVGEDSLRVSSSSMMVSPSGESPAGV